MEGSPDQDLMNKFGVKVEPLFEKETRDESGNGDGNDLQEVLDWIVDVLGKTLITPRETSSDCGGTRIGFSLTNPI